MMAGSYLVPAQEARAEIRVVNSRFIASLAPAFSVEEARAFITRIEDEFPDATHNVPAYVIGHGASVIAHCNDDGEPAGTAGRPSLAVLSGSGLGDVVVVVTRYFGGTKLGTGGLVRAYGDAVRAVLEVTPRARRVPTHTVELVTPYALFEPLRVLISEHGGRTLDESFAGEVTLTAQLPVVEFEAFQRALGELGRGALSAEVLATDEATLLPDD